MPAKDAKDTLYVDVDDEITTIIDKVRSSGGKVVALVLPKRAPVLQSIVNMKLLKRTAEDAKKHLVLVTTEAGLLPLAGSVGLHVASTATSKPVIPPAPVGPGDETEDIEEPLAMSGEETEAYDPEADANTPVGKLAAAGVAGKLAGNAIDEEIVLDDELPAAATAPAGKKPKPNKKLKVPNFDSFRSKLLLGAGVLVLLIVGWVFAFKVLPKATVTVSTDTTTVTTTLNLNLDTAAKTVDTKDKIVPATAQSVQKSFTQQAAASGQQNNGERATGSVKFTAKVCTQPIGTPPSSIPTGSGVSAGGKTYITQSSMSFGFTGFSSGGSCADYTSNTGDILAQAGGTGYNVTDATFAVNGRSDVSGTGSAEGGTDNIVKIVSQADIDAAKAKITAQDTTAIRAELQAALEAKGLQAVVPTFVTGEPQATTSAKVGDAADSVSVTEVITYTMLGVKRSDLKTLVTTNVNSKIDKDRQSILDDGVAKAKITITSAATPTGANITFSAKSVAGPQIDEANVKQQVAGKKTGEIKTLLKQTPGVTEVEVSYSPFWVSSVPTNVEKITVELKKSNTGKE
jgi:hypothetical protein